MYRPSHRPSFRLRMFPSPFARLFGMVSAPFATNNTVTKGTKLPKSRTVIRKLSFVHRNHAALSLTIAAQFLRCRRRSSLVTAVRFSNGQKALSIVYSGAKYVRSALKIALTWKSLFRVVENGKFLNRLLNGHLEKSAVHRPFSCLTFTQDRESTSQGAP